MTLTKKELYAFTRKFYKALQYGHRVEFKKMRLTRGWINMHDDKDDAHIALDHRDALVPTLIHEFIHYLNPDMCESKVLEMEKAIIQRLTDRQIRNILKRFADVL